MSLDVKVLLFVFTHRISSQAVIDLLIPGQTPGIKEPIVDLCGKSEILFFGPDEGTADMMDWAACSFSLNLPVFIFPEIPFVQCTPVTAVPRHGGSLSPPARAQNSWVVFLTILMA
jgi:hypothetical protein